MPDRDEIARAYHPLRARPSSRRPDTAVIEIEIIGNPRIGSTPQSGIWRVLGLGSNDGFDREPIQFFRDYSRANSVGSRGVYQIYFLRSENIYEVKAPKSWRSFDHYFCRVAGGQIIRMNIHQVLAWLKNNWA